MEAARAVHAYSGVARRRRIKPASLSGRKKNSSPSSGVRALAEGIILQAIEDLADAGRRKESLQFFRGEGFDLWSGIARMNLLHQIRLARLIAGADSAGDRAAQ